jgi:CheY-like chemotaxis protein
MKKLVLLAEDQPDIREMMRILLQSYGYDVIQASDGYEAVELALQRCPDVILMDMAMPVLDGLQSVRAMRRHKELAKVPIVAVTAFGDFYNQRALDAGCTHVLHKPLDFEVLRPIVQGYMD